MNLETIATTLETAATSPRLLGLTSARAAIWRQPTPVDQAQAASETFLRWRDTEGWKTIDAWAPGPPEEIGKRALLACAAWVRSREQVEVPA